MSDEYNGWANRETWAFNLHWQNDQGFYGYVLDFARQWLDDWTGSDDSGVIDFRLGEDVVRDVEQELPELSPELWENLRSNVGSFWRINTEEVGRCVPREPGERVMIDWDSPSWGNTVHEDPNGSWLPDWRDSGAGDPS